LGPTLPAPARSLLEPTFGHSLDSVRVHDDAATDSMLRASQATALTMGDDLFFRAGGSDFDSPQSLHVLAHELTHVVQQSAAPSTASSDSDLAFDFRPAFDTGLAPDSGVAFDSGLAPDARPARGVRGDAFEREAHATADAVLSGSSPAPPTPTPSPSAPAAQFLFDFDFDSINPFAPVSPAPSRPTAPAPSEPSIWDKPWMPWDSGWDDWMNPAPVPGPVQPPVMPQPSMPDIGPSPIPYPSPDPSTPEDSEAARKEALIRQLQGMDLGSSASSEANVAESSDDNLVGEILDATGLPRENIVTDVLEGGWDLATNEIVGGALGLADAAKGAGGGVLGAAGKVGQFLSPLSILEGGLDVYQSIAGDDSGFENTEKGVLGGLNILGGGTSVLGMLGVLPEVAGSTALGTLGGAGAGSLAAAGGQVLGSGLAGYAAGRGIDYLTGLAMRETGLGESLDEGIDSVLDYTGLGDVMESVGGPDAEAGNRGDYTLSGLGARMMTGADQLFTAGMRETGMVDEEEPAYTQTVGWQLAEMLPSWLQ